MVNGRKHYLGDGAYVDFDGYALVLTAEDGMRATDTVVLEPRTWEALLNYVREYAPHLWPIDPQKGDPE